MRWTHLRGTRDVGAVPACSAPRVKLRRVAGDPCDPPAEVEELGAFLRRSVGVTPVDRSGAACPGYLHSTTSTAFLTDIDVALDGTGPDGTGL